jgi:hypothetical protein
MLLPEQELDPTYEHEPAPVEFIVLDAPAAAPEPELDAQPPLRPAAGPDDPVADLQPPDRSRSRRAVARAGAETEVVAEPSAEPVDGAGGQGLALSGLRQRGRAGPAPKGTGIAPGETQIQHRPELALREAAGPSRRSDGSPRSLAEAGFQRRRNGRLVYRDPAGKFKAILHENGRLEFRNMPVAIRMSDSNPSRPSGIGMPGLSEAVRAAQGNELYRNEKKRLLEETFDLRLSLAVGFARRHLDAQLDQLHRDLLEVWRDDRQSAASRRRRLFDRWDECEELSGALVKLELDDLSGAAESELDRLRSEAGRDARKRIEAFIRRHLPRENAEAYSTDELERLNRHRRSRARFDPYG